MDSFDRSEDSGPDILLSECYEALEQQPHKNRREVQAAV